MKKSYSPINKISYGVGDMYAGGAFLLVSLFFVHFLNVVVGLPGVITSMVFFIGKVWDAISDPLMGYISDHTKSRFGKRKLYFMIGIFPIFLSFALMWLVVDGSIAAKAVYYTFAYIFFNTTFTLVMVPYNSLLPNMVPEYKDRTSFTTYRLMFSTVSAILSGTIPYMFISQGDTSGSGYITVGIIFGLIYALPWLLVIKNTWENPVEREETKRENPFKVIYREFRSSLRNKSFRRHASFFISAQAAVDFLTTLFIYYLTYVIFRDHQFSIILGILLVMQLLSMPIHNMVARKFEKRTPFIIGLSVWAVSLIFATLITDSSPGFFIYIVALLSGFGTSAAVFAPWSILPEISDVDEIITGQRREGMYAGMSTFLRKIAQALAVSFIGIYLDLIKFDPDVVPTDATRNGIKFIFSFGPIVFILLAIFMIYRYTMTHDKHTVLMKEIENRKTEHIASSDPVVIEVCEELTGLPYESLALEEFIK